MLEHLHAGWSASLGPHFSARSATHFKIPLYNMAKKLPGGMTDLIWEPLCGITHPPRRPDMTFQERVTQTDVLLAEKVLQATLKPALTSPWCYRQATERNERNQLMWTNTQEASATRTTTTDAMDDMAHNDEGLGTTHYLYDTLRHRPWNQHQEPHARFHPGRIVLQNSEAAWTEETLLYILTKLHRHPDSADCHLSLIATSSKTPCHGTLDVRSETLRRQGGGQSPPVVPRSSATPSATLSATHLHSHPQDTERRSARPDPNDADSLETRYRRSQDHCEAESRQNDHPSRRPAKRETMDEYKKSRLSVQV